MRRDSTDEVWVASRRPLGELAARVSTSVGTRLRRLWPAAVGRVPARAGRAGGGPHFTVDDGAVPFERLEAIVFHPEVLRAIEENRVPLPALRAPAARLPAGALRVAGVPRATPRRIYDICPFSVELDVLELRLTELYDVVDRFIVVEAAEGFGGPTKPLFLQRNLARFARFREKLVPLVLAPTVAAATAGRQRLVTDFRGEATLRTATWRAARAHVPRGPEALVLWGDVDEIPPRNVLHWLRHYDVPLPLRIRARSLRYNFGWADPEVTADIVAFAPDDLGDAEGHSFRHLDGMVVHARGAVHLTSFLPPLALMAKFALTTEWDPGLLPYLRNQHDEAAGMMAAGHWFGRPLARYDAETDVDGLVPWAARACRDRFASCWPPS